MSRSYKKHPIFKDNDGAGKKKSWKKIYNRKIRRQGIDVPSGGAFKKYNDPWNICDFSFEPDPNDPIEMYRARMK